MFLSVLLKLHVVTDTNTSSTELLQTSVEEPISKCSYLRNRYTEYGSCVIMNHVFVLTAPDAATLHHEG